MRNGYGGLQSVINGITCVVERDMAHPPWPPLHKGGKRTAASAFATRCPTSRESVGPSRQALSPLVKGGPGGVGHQASAVGRIREHFLQNAKVHHDDLSHRRHPPRARRRTA